MALEINLLHFSFLFFKFSCIILFSIADGGLEVDASRFCCQ